MLRFLLIILFCTALFSGPANAAYVNLQGDYGKTILDNTTGMSGTTRGLVGRLTSGAYTIATNASQLCGSVFSGTTCASIFGFADPRNFGGYCDSYFNQNNTTHDDSVGIQAAINTGYPVLIPKPGCKIASNKINFTADSQTIFSFGGGGSYYEQFPGTPYIFITNHIAINRATTLNCAFDTKGFDDITFRNITMRANYNMEGTVGICNSVGLAGGRGAAFLNIDHVSFLNMGNGIGGAMTSYEEFGASNKCTPTGSLQHNVFMVRGNRLNVTQSCMGMYGNFSDVHLSDLYFSALFHNCYAQTDGGGAATDLTNVRCEWSGQGVGGTLHKDGTGLYIATPYSANISNVVCDRQQGPCLTVSPTAKSINITNANAHRSGISTSVTNRCHYVILGGSNISMTNMGSYANNTPYVLCITGASDNVTYRGQGNYGYTTAYSNISTVPTHFTFDVPGISSSMVGTKVAVGTITPTSGTSIDYGSLTDSMLIPKGTAAQRPVVVEGMIRYNTDTHTFEGASGLTPTFQSLGGTTLPTPSDGNCLVGSGGAWVAGSCSGTSNMLLGTATGTTNPQVSGDITTGLFSDTASTVSVSTAGIKTTQFGTLDGGVDYFTITPGKSGTNPKITVAGSTANQGLTISAKGSGTISISNKTAQLYDDGITSGFHALSTVRRGVYDPGVSLGYKADGAFSNYGYVAFTGGSPRSGAIVVTAGTGYTMLPVAYFTSSDETTPKMGVGTTTPQTTLDVNGLLKIKGYTVSTLPTGIAGSIAYVTDQLTSCPSSGSSLTGGGSAVCTVFYNGTSWVKM